ncbi:MAG: ABC transporter permease [Bacteroidales bacterium]|nr:ABC transporter permease [Bacteroidales bacterium]
MESRAENKKRARGLKVVLIQLKEGISFTINELKGNKFRTFLSLLGVSFGIFTIVAIFTAIDALRSNVMRGFESLSSNMIQVSKWPMGLEDEDGNISLVTENFEYRWWDYMKRPNITYEDYKYLKENSQKAKALLYISFGNANMKYGRNSISSATVLCSTEGLGDVMNLELESGRLITLSEYESAAPVVLLGNNIAETLFDGEDAIGKIVKLKGADYSVVGVFAKQGESLLNMVQTDGVALIPFLNGRQFFNMRDTDGELDVVGKEGVPTQELAQEIKQLLRQFRRLRPGEKYNFSINELSAVEGLVENIIGVINNVGWIIAAFSLLIGGFGIANIMFVSVKERTNIIGIQKALGAKRYFIMTQFLTEAVFLAVAGALVGIALIAFIIWIAPIPAEYQVALSFSNTLKGILIASVIGVLSGILPAWSAARLNPVDAINSK